MHRMTGKTLTLCAGISLAVLASPAGAATLIEAGDAGQSIATAQSAVGFDEISGSLQVRLRFLPDIDFYEIFITDVDAFSVTMTSALSADNDTELFLFNGKSDLVISDDDGGPGLRSQFNAGELSGSDAGIYYLAVTIFDAEAQDGGQITVDPGPMQSGPYTLSLTGIGSPVTPIPLPPALPLLAVGLGLLSLSSRRRKG